MKTHHSASRAISTVGLRARLLGASRVGAVASMLAVIAAAGASAAPGDDPLGSVMWTEMKEMFFDGEKVVFDERVKVSVPNVVENQAQVPVTADARALGEVKRMIVFADLNPIQHVLTLTPVKSKAYVAFRMKVEQGTPIRAAAQTADGVWHVGGVYLDAAGGGCSAPAMARNQADWSETVGQAQGRVWRQADGSARVRVRMRHPMDTGLALDNTPAFFVERLQVAGSGGSPLANIEMSEPVSEDPTLTLQLTLPLSDRAVHVNGRDNSGSIFRSEIPATFNPS